MKFVNLLVVFLIITIGCKKNYVYEKIDKNWLTCTGSNVPWRLVSQDVGREMERQFRECQNCKLPTRYTFDSRHLIELERFLKELGIEVSDINLVPAVYTRESVERYACRVCGGNRTDEKCQVENYRTLLIKAYVPESEEGFLYFDAVSICPPPRGCDMLSVASDTTNTIINQDSTRRTN